MRLTRTAGASNVRIGPPGVLWKERQQTRGRPFSRLCFSDGVSTLSCFNAVLFPPEFGSSSDAKDDGPGKGALGQVPLRRLSENGPQRSSICHCHAYPLRSLGRRQEPLLFFFASAAVRSLTLPIVLHLVFWLWYCPASGRCHRCGCRGHAVRGGRAAPP